ncbi:unnamed protein product [Auanema sp. JU1783]|nr:unnamed protein product [Auanema sp. JU1783]
MFMAKVFHFLSIFIIVNADLQSLDASTSASAEVSASTALAVADTSAVGHIRAKRQWGGCCGVVSMCCSMPRPIPVPVPVPQPVPIPHPIPIPMPIPPPIPPPMIGFGSCCGCCVPVCMPMCMRGGCGCGMGMGMGIGMYGRKKREALIRANHPVLRLSWDKPMENTFE